MGRGRRREEPTPRKLLIAACRYGGDREELVRLVAQFPYSQDDLRAAIDALSRSVSSALENNIARENQRFLEGLVRGMDFRSRH